jgi:hypothetical protein
MRYSENVGKALFSLSAPAARGRLKFPKGDFRPAQIRKKKTAAIFGENAK